MHGNMLYQNQQALNSSGYADEHSKTMNTALLKVTPITPNVFYFFLLYCCLAGE